MGQTNAFTARADVSEPLFRSLVVSSPAPRGGRHTAMLAASVVLHGALALAVAVLPLLFAEALPAEDSLRAFFVEPLELAPPPPPPPPVPAGVRPAATVAPKTQVRQTQGFVAPIEMPHEITPEDGFDLGGLEGGVPGGVEGGVPGGVVGGIVGGLPAVAPPPPGPKVVQIGGQIAAPRLVRRVDPVYPDLARLSRVTALVILEAEVDTRGHVKSVRVLRGHPLFDESAMEALRQWRYQPLLLNGEPYGFVLTVTMGFQLRTDG
jgi:protein TonB